MTSAPTADPGVPDPHAPAPDQRELANAIRALAMDAVQAANSGHPGMPMGMADVATVLFGQFLRFDPSAPDWPDRDRFVLSAGHGSMLLYALLHLTGYPDMDIEQLKRFRQLGSRTAGHPEYGHAPGIETTTGPLGQGLGNAVGMALAERHLRARFGAELVDHRTYAIVSDGDLMEGISHEACALAGHQRLDRLILLFDDNHISIDGSTELASSTTSCAASRPMAGAPSASTAMIRRRSRPRSTAAQSADRPSLIACRTTIGFGAPTKAGTAATHGSPLGPDEIAGAREKLGWPYPPFEIPEPIRAAWRALRQPRRRRARPPGRIAWRRRRQPLRAEFERAQAGALPEGLDRVLQEHKARLVEEQPSWATRKASQEALEVFTAAVPELIGGSADLTGSVNTKTKMTVPITPANPGGRYVHYGVREHAMAAAMNGMALHKGVIPYGGTFLIFSDYCRPAIRLAALMGQRVIFVLTHDSIGLGEDGPTHQPVEHLAALRAIPNLRGVPPGRCGRDRRVLGARPGARGRAVGHGADPAEPARAAHHARGRQPLRPRRLCSGAGRGPARRDPARHRLRGRARARGARPPAGLWPRLRVGLDAVLRAVRPAGRGLSQGGSGPGAADRRRGRLALRLDALRPPRGGRRRDAQLRRLGTL